MKIATESDLDQWIDNLMRGPSRHMRKLPDTLWTLLRWIALILVCAPFLYLLWNAPVLSILGVVLIVMVGIVSSYFHRQHLHQLMEGRDQGPRSLCAFARSLDLPSRDTRVIRAVYEELQSEATDLVRDFPISPSDRLVEDLKIDGEELDFYLIPRIAERTGKSLENSEANSLYGKVKTAEDLVLFFNQQP
ncbi:hypothetical protein MRY87_12615 [bacterium]|nr:hypothetical protein [bacterium]